MAEPRRVRDEALVLHRAGEQQILSRHQGVAYRLEPAVPTQRRFQVSSDARQLAFARPGDGEVRLLRRDGRETPVARATGDLRFSPDGRALAVVVTEESGWHRLDLLSEGGRRRAPWGDV